MATYARGSLPDTRVGVGSAVAVAAGAVLGELVQSPARALMAAPARQLALRRRRAAAVSVVTADALARVGAQARWLVAAGAQGGLFARDELFARPPPVGRMAREAVAMTGARLCKNRSVALPAPVAVDLPAMGVVTGNASLMTFGRVDVGMAWSAGSAGRRR